MNTKALLEDLKNVVLNGDQDLAREKARKALDAGLAPLEALEEGLSKGMEVIGDRFATGEAFLPELLMAADTFTAAMDVLTLAIKSTGIEAKKNGKVVLATVKGDVHNLGKNIVATLMETNSFEVIDLGVDQSTLDIIEAAKESNADVIGLSSVMTTSMPYQKEFIETLKEMDLRERFIVLVGGGPVDQPWAQQIGADGYGATAIDAVQIARKMLRDRKEA
jgi:corrinoid protein of di/trimethylamine methyltransferase